MTKNKLSPREKTARKIKYLRGLFGVDEHYNITLLGGAGLDDIYGVIDKKGTVILNYTGNSDYNFLVMVLGKNLIRSEVPIMYSLRKKVDTKRIGREIIYLTRLLEKQEPIN